MNDTPILAESTDSGKVKGRDFLRIKRERGGGCVLRTWLSDKPVAVNVDRASAPSGLDLRDVFAYGLFPNQLRPSGLLLGQVSSGQRRPIMRRASRLHSWDVFAYGLFPDRLRPSDLALGQASKGLKRLASALNILGDSYGIRTHEPAVRGRCLNHLTKEPLNMDYYITCFAVWQYFFSGGRENFFCRA